MTTPNDKTHIPEGAVEAALASVPIIGPDRITGRSLAAALALGNVVDWEPAAAYVSAALSAALPFLPSPSEEARPVAWMPLDAANLDEIEAKANAAQNTSWRSKASVEFRDSYGPSTMLALIAMARVALAAPPAAPMPAGAGIEQFPAETTSPDRIRVAQDRKGFWTCREAKSGSLEYVRADLVEAKDKRIAELEATNTRLLGLIADIREKSGLGAKPMLDELPDAIGALISKSGNAELIERLTEALKRAEYQPGDHPVVPVKIAAFMDEVRSALSRSPSLDGAEGMADKVIAAIQSVADNPPSHDAGICLDMAIRAVRASLNATRST